MDKFIELLSQILKKYLISKGYVWIGEHIDVVLIGLLGTGLIPAGYKLLKYIHNLLRKRRLAKDLHPYFDKSVTDKAIEFFVPTTCQNVDPCIEHEPKETHAFATREKLVPFFIEKAFKKEITGQRYYLVLADSGMGKTTFMINLFTCYQNQLFGKKYKIKLFPLGDDRVDDSIVTMSESQKLSTILLLDGLDDDPKAWNNHEKRLNDLMQKASLFREVVITCRTQFFASADKEPYETGIRKFDTEGGGQYIFKKIYLSPFDDKDVRLYLNKKYGRFSLINRTKKKLARLIVEKSPNLMVRPMLLSYIDDLVAPIENADNVNHFKVAPIGSTDKVNHVNYTYTYEIYSALIDKWIQREAKRVPVKKRPEFISNLYYFSKQVALSIVSNNANEGLVIDTSEILTLARSFEINLDELELKARSLLNRNIEGKYKFAHKSILEYFLAVSAYQDRQVTNMPDGNMKILASFNLHGFDQAKRFFVEMCLSFPNALNVRYAFQNVTVSSFAKPKRATKRGLSDILKNKYNVSEPQWVDSRTLLLRQKYTKDESVSFDGAKDSP